MKPVSYYENIEKNYGLTARRAAESADKMADAVVSGETDFGSALASVCGAAYRPGVYSGR